MQRGCRTGEKNHLRSPVLIAPFKQDLKLCTFAWALLAFLAWFHENEVPEIIFFRSPHVIYYKAQDLYLLTHLLFSPV